MSAKSSNLTVSRIKTMSVELFLLAGLKTPAYAADGALLGAAISLSFGTSLGAIQRAHTSDVESVFVHPECRQQIIL